MWEYWTGGALLLKSSQRSAGTRFRRLQRSWGWLVSEELVRAAIVWSCAFAHRMAAVPVFFSCFRTLRDPALNPLFVGV